MKSKFNLGWILSVGAALVLAAMGFMSFYYLNGGKLLWSIIVAVCLLVVPIVVCMQLEKAKLCSKPFYFKKSAVTETVMLGIMLVVFVGGMGLINHFFTVNGRTKQIEDIVADQRQQLDSMTASYNDYVNRRVENWRSLLEEVVNNKVGNEQFCERLFESTDLADMTKVEFMVTNLEGNLSILNDSVPDVMNREKLSWWQLPSVMNNVDEISGALQAKYNVLAERAKNDTTDIAILREYGEEHTDLGITVPEYWSYSYTTASEVMKCFTEPDGFISSIWTVVCGLVGILLILLPYLTAERDSRSKGLFKELLKDEDDDEEETGIGRL